VIFNEPSRTPYDLNFRVLGIPVRVHPLFWLVALLLGLGGGGGRDLVPLLFWVGTAFVSILIHELGHALAARSYGWEPWITLHGFGGLASYRPTYREPKSQILISLAGPGAGFLFAAVIVFFIAASGHHVQFTWPNFVLPIWFEPLYQSRNLNRVLYYLLFINIFWGLVNLLPIYPLDGGQISHEVFQMVNPRDGVQQALWLSIIVAVAAGVFAWTRLGDQFLAIFCAYLAYTSYTTLQSYSGRGGSGWGGFR
jgi:Zn-dependent protease